RVRSVGRPVWSGQPASQTNRQTHPSPAQSSGQQGSCMNRAWLIAIPLTMVSLGCAVDQHKEVEIYQSQLRLSEHRVEHRPGEPLTLKTTVLLANQNDEQLASRGEAYLRAVIQQRRTLANFLPTVDLVPVYSRREKVASDTGNNSQDRYLDAPVDASINLFNGFQDINRGWRDEYVARQRRNDLLFAQEQLLVDSAGVFFQVLRSEASVRVLESSLKLQDERYRDVKGRLDAGI